MVINFSSYLKKLIEFSKKTFGPGDRTDGIIDHIEKELVEIRQAPLDVEEWIDVVLLSLDGAWRCASMSYPKAKPEELADKVISMLMHKTKKNELRSWPDWRTIDPGKAILHIKDDDHSLRAFHESQKSKCI